jgi:hypothetical protein
MSDLRLQFEYKGEADKPLYCSKCCERIPQPFIICPRCAGLQLKDGEWRIPRRRAGERK